MRKAANLLRERADAIAPLMTHGAGQDARRGEGRDPRRRRHHRLVRRGGAPHLRPRDPGARRGRLPAGRSRSRSARSRRSRRGTSRSTRSVRKLSAALAAGCSIIVKAPEETPASPAELIRAFVDAGVPAGVVNLVYGDPAEISEYLIPHPVIRKISFTGSTVVGKQLAALAGPAHEARDDGARRPRAGDRLRRRRRRRRREGDGAQQVPQRRAGLHLADALPGAGGRLRRVRRAVRRPTPRRSRSATASTRTSRWARSPIRAARRRWRSIVEDAGKHGGKVRDRRPPRSATRATSTSRRSSPSCPTTRRR